MESLVENIHIHDGYLLGKFNSLDDACLLFRKEERMPSILNEDGTLSPNR